MATKLFELKLQELNNIVLKQRQRFIGTDIFFLKKSLKNTILQKFARIKYR